MKAGEPVLIAGVDVKILGQAKDDSAYKDLLKTGEPKIGTVLNHGTYDSFKNSLTSIAVRRGYFDATMPVHQLGVIEDERKAFWDIDFDSGKRYRFGDVTFEGSQIREEYLQHLVPSNRGNITLLSSWLNSAVVYPPPTGSTRWWYRLILNRQPPIKSCR